MSDVKQREDKIKAKRMQTPRREFVKEIGSWDANSVYKHDGLLTRYPQKRALNIVPYKEFDKIRDTMTQYGRDYVRGSSFFDQFQKLFYTVPMASIITYGSNENTDYADQILSSKNVYLSFVVITDCENVAYAYNCKDGCSNVLNSMYVQDHSQNIYFCNAVFRSSNVFYSRCVFNSYNVRFSTNLQGCQECLFCNDLVNQKYCIHNKQFDKESYQQEKEKLLQQKDLFHKFYMKVLDTPLLNIASQNVKGTCIIESQNVEGGLFNYHLSHARNAIFTASPDVNTNCFDVICAGSPLGGDYYGMLGTGGGFNCYCGCHIIGSNIYYSYHLENCSYCLGCVGLINKQFCILNKEYTKEERFRLANEIFAQMDQEGVLGNVFPATMNPRYFNDSIAYMIDNSFTKEEITKEGYLRRDEEIKVDIPQGADVVETQNLASREGFDTQGNWKINPDILKKVIKDEKGNYYRIVKMEYDFLMKHGLPLPELHRLERIKLGFRFK